MPSIGIEYLIDLLEPDAKGLHPLGKAQLQTAFLYLASRQGKPPTEQAVRKIETYLYDAGVNVGHNSETLRTLKLLRRCARLKQCLPGKQTLSLKNELRAPKVCLTGEGIEFIPNAGHWSTRQRPINDNNPFAAIFS